MSLASPAFWQADSLVLSHLGCPRGQQRCGQPHLQRILQKKCFLPLTWRWLLLVPFGEFFSYVQFFMFLFFFSLTLSHTHTHIHIYTYNLSPQFSDNVTATRLIKTSSIPLLYFQNLIYQNTDSQIPPSLPESEIGNSEEVTLNSVLLESSSRHSNDQPHFQITGVNYQNFNWRKKHFLVGKKKSHNYEFNH